ncbi:putative ferric reductase [Rubricella aquisinus]|uniref:Putative ferric reductase n=1 Tax=Rubricella aquisinus TaxID=2028108 RepID=A0A840X4C0_9RHOB|nr:ferredoxin reductase family protein [Rubricella aquisinus]MBB5515517.1 putative ferric reductase [Rubricella aquisinus]
MTPFGLFLILGTVLVPAFQLFTLPDVADQIALFSQYLGMAALILMAWSQILATRALGIEPLFGGMDRVYVVHKWAGIAAMGAVLLHDTIDAEMDGLGRETLLTSLAETMGEVSLYGLLILVALSVLTFVPYHLWRWTHKAMGVLFAAGALHFVFILKPFAMTDPAGMFTGAFCVAGVLAYGWTLLPETWRPKATYTVTQVEQTGGAVAITMRPDGRALSPRPGQFGVLRFPDARMDEPHPFSFSQIGEDGSLRVTVKALGDFTGRLGARVAPGQRVTLQGPYGRFTRRGSGPQVWIAGGIGITPFLTWAAALKPDIGPVHLFYCVKDRAMAPHLAEVEALARSLPNLTLHLVVSGEGARLTGAYIAEKAGFRLSKAHVAFCGPVSLREALKPSLARRGVSRRRFAYEEFEFRTGIGLDRLAAWLWRRALDRGAAIAAERG